MTSTTLSSLINTTKESFGSYCSSFYYRVFSYVETDDEARELTDGVISCLGYIGDTISLALYNDAECTGFFKDDINKALHIHRSGVFSDTTHFVYIFPIPTETNRQSKIDKITAFVEMVSQNWEMNLELRVGKTMMLIVPKEVLFATKWKFQAVMQLVRYIWYKDVTFTSSDQAHFYGDNKYKGYIQNGPKEPYSTNLWHQQNMIYTLATKKVDNTHHYVDRYNNEYGKYGLTTYSQTKGVMSLITPLAKAYEIIS